MLNETLYYKVTSPNASCLEAHAGLFRLLIKGIFDPYVLGPIDICFKFVALSKYLNFRK